ncbi:unnamed protein product [Amoebophrya sp. A120]|nr:unnamed protein product [Amoebophrya sp. A120]|eukprot:GSA120T00009792001.1
MLELDPVHKEFGSPERPKPKKTSVCEEASPASCSSKKLLLGAVCSVLCLFTVAYVYKWQSHLAASSSEVQKHDAFHDFDNNFDYKGKYGYRGTTSTAGIKPKSKARGKKGAKITAAAAASTTTSSSADLLGSSSLENLQELNPDGTTSAEHQTVGKKQSQKLVQEQQSEAELELQERKRVATKVFSRLHKNFDRYQRLEEEFNKNGTTSSTVSTVSSATRAAASSSASTGAAATKNDTTSAVDNNTSSGATMIMSTKTNTSSDFLYYQSVRNRTARLLEKISSDHLEQYLPHWDSISVALQREFYHGPEQIITLLPPRVSEKLTVDLAMQMTFLTSMGSKKSVHVEYDDGNNGMESDLFDLYLYHPIEIAKLLIQDLKLLDMDHDTQYNKKYLLQEFTVALSKDTVDLDKSGKLDLLEFATLFARTTSTGNATSTSAGGDEAEEDPVGEKNCKLLEILDLLAAGKSGGLIAPEIVDQAYGILFGEKRKEELIAALKSSAEDHGKKNTVRYCPDGELSVYVCNAANADGKFNPFLLPDFQHEAPFLTPEQSESVAGVPPALAANSSVTSPSLKGIDLDMDKSLCKLYNYAFSSNMKSASEEEVKTVGTACEALSSYSGQSCCHWVESDKEKNACRPFYRCLRPVGKTSQQVQLYQEVFQDDSLGDVGPVEKFHETVDTRTILPPFAAYDKYGRKRMDLLGAKTLDMEEEMKEEM